MSSRVNRAYRPCCRSCCNATTWWSHRMSPGARRSRGPRRLLYSRQPERAFCRQAAALSGLHQGLSPSSRYLGQTGTTNRQATISAAARSVVAPGKSGSWRQARTVRTGRRMIGRPWRAWPETSREPAEARQTGRNRTPTPIATPRAGRLSWRPYGSVSLAVQVVRVREVEDEVAVDRRRVARRVAGVRAARQALEHGRHVRAVEKGDRVAVGARIVEHAVGRGEDKARQDRYWCGIQVRGHPMRLPPAGQQRENSGF